MAAQDQKPIGSGYGARIFLLSRPPGYGVDGVLADPDAEARKFGEPEEAKDPGED